MAQVRHFLGPMVIVRLRQAGFTVDDSGPPPGTNTITWNGSPVLPSDGGGPSGLLAKLLVGGKAKVARLRQLGIWSS
jgi:hypothetical protein